MDFMRDMRHPIHTMWMFGIVNGGDTESLSLANQQYGHNMPHASQFMHDDRKP